LKNSKNAIKIDGHNHLTKDNMEGQKMAKKLIAHKNQKGRKLIPLLVGSYLTHHSFNVKL
jgi:hypothetical protein